MNAFLSKPLRADALGVMRAHAEAHADHREAEDAQANAREQHARKGVAALSL
jgi:hypothetical protein